MAELPAAKVGRVPENNNRVFSGYQGYLLTPKCYAIANLHVA